MIVFTILIAVVVLFGSLVMHVLLMEAELKGYDQALDEVEQMMDEVRNE